MLTSIRKLATTGLSLLVHIDSSAALSEFPPPCFLLPQPSPSHVTIVV
jgi:hypothetical protein